jgi:hypothetical protein
MFRTRKVQLYTVLTLLAIVAFTVPGLAISTVSVQLTGAGGAQHGLGANYAYGQYLMPYYLTINGSNPIAVVCDDYLHHVSVGEQWTGTLSTFSDLSNTRFGTGASLQYHEAIWIAAQINGNSSLTDIAGAQFAIWKLLTPGTPDVPGASGWIAAAQAAAGNNFAGINFANWEILTPLNPLSPQEYFFQIPEPSIYLDLGFALLAYVTMRTVQRRRNEVGISAEASQ